MTYARSHRKSRNVLGLESKIFDHCSSRVFDHILPSHQVRWQLSVGKFPDLGKFFYRTSSMNSELTHLFFLNFFVNRIQISANALNPILQINMRRVTARWCGDSSMIIIWHLIYLENNNGNDNVSLCLTTYLWPIPISQQYNIYWMSFHIGGTPKMLIELFDSVAWRAPD